MHSYFMGRDGLSLGSWVSVKIEMIQRRWEELEFDVSVITLRT